MTSADLISKAKHAEPEPWLRTALLLDVESEESPVPWLWFPELAADSRAWADGYRSLDRSKRELHRTWVEAFTAEDLLVTRGDARARGLQIRGLLPDTRAYVSSGWGGHAAPLWRLDRLQELAAQRAGIEAVRWQRMHARQPTAWDRIVADDQ